MDVFTQEADKAGNARRHTIVQNSQNSCRLCASYAACKAESCPFQHLVFTRNAPAALKMGWADEDK